MRFREQRLAQAVAIPPSAVGRLRMSKAEQQDLWKLSGILPKLARRISLFGLM
jgi:hypothetical protein